MRKRILPVTKKPACREIALPLEIVERKILLVHGQKVMLDRDLAALYGVETRVLNQAVRRNLGRFPADFMFGLSRDEILSISQFVTSLKFSKTVFVFTEQGVAMLSGILNSPRAVQANIQIMRAFVKLRRLLAGQAEISRKLESMELKYDAQFRDVFDAIMELMDSKEIRKRRKIGFIVDKKR